jgi:small-conductance mechanosensitive channel
MDPTQYLAMEPLRHITEGTMVVDGGVNIMACGQSEGTKVKHAGGLIRGFILAAILLQSVIVGAVDKASDAKEERAAVPAALLFQNRTVIVFRASVLGHTPSARAEAAEQRIERLIRKGGEGIVTTRVIPQGMTIELDGTSMFAVTPEDVDELGGDTLQSTVDEAVRMLAIAVKEAHEQVDLWRMLKAAGLAVLATLLYAALLYGVVATRRRLISRLSSALKARVEHLKVGGVIALHPSQVLVSVRRLVIIASWLVALLATNVWLTFSLELFPYTRPWGEQLRGYLLGLLTSMLRAMVHALPGLLTVVIIFAITRFLARIVEGFFRRIQAQHIRIGWLDEDTAKPTQRIVVFVLWLFALVMAYPYLPGAQSDAFKGLSVLVGLMVSIGASSLVGQAASGMILMYARALRPGDYVKIGDAEGTVGDLTLLATRLKTGTGEEVVLPNTFVVANITRNFSREAFGHGFVVQVKVTIGYSTPWRQVHAMLLESARRTRGILADPEPYVIQSALSDFYVEYKLVAFAGPDAPAQRAIVISDLNANVQDVFNEYGVQIMSPHYLGDPEHPQIVPKERWFEAPARKPDG